jgi:hypothetical protein
MKSFSVKNFNREVSKVLKNANTKQKANVRCAMLYKALRYQVKGN